MDPVMLRVWIISLLLAMALYALEKPKKPSFRGHEKFDDNSKDRFTKFPLDGISIFRNGVLYTRQPTGTEKKQKIKHPNQLCIPISEKDFTLSFRYRFLDTQKAMIWLFINGNDSFGGYDHILRVKFTKNLISPSIDAHTLDPKHPKIQKGRKPDPVSNAYRYGEKVKPDKVKFNDNKWHTAKLDFVNESVIISVDDNTYKRELKRPAFNVDKQEIGMFLVGGDKGMELDDLKVMSN